MPTVSNLPSVLLSNWGAQNLGALAQGGFTNRGGVTNTGNRLGPLERAVRAAPARGGPIPKETPSGCSPACFSCLWGFLSE